MTKGRYLFATWLIFAFAAGAAVALIEMWFAP